MDYQYSQDNFDNNGSSITQGNWYDNVPAMVSMAEQMQMQFKENRILVAETMMQYLQREPVLRKILLGVRQLGLPKLMEVYKGEHRRNWYDGEFPVKQFFKALYIFEMPEQKIVAEKTIKLISLLQVYENLCQQYGLPLNQEDTGKIARTFIESNNPDKVKKLLLGFQQEFSQYYQTYVEPNLPPATKPSEPEVVKEAIEPEKTESELDSEALKRVASTDQGMKIGKMKKK
jgi:hypothetical protein